MEASKFKQYRKAQKGDWKPTSITDYRDNTANTLSHIFPGIYLWAHTVQRTIKCRDTHMKSHGHFSLIYSSLYHEHHSRWILKPYGVNVLNHVFSQFFNVTYNSVVSLNWFRDLGTRWNLLNPPIRHSLHQVFKVRSSQVGEHLWPQLAAADDQSSSHLELLAVSTTQKDT